MAGFEHLSLASSLYLGLPDRQLFRIPSEAIRKPAIPIPRKEFVWYRPFNVSPSLYERTTDLKFAILGISIYMGLSLILNYINRARANRPWPISRSRGFLYLTLVHNVSLSLFSGWVFWGLWRAFQFSLRRELPVPYHVQVADALCKIIDPPGMQNGSLSANITVEHALLSPDGHSVGGLPSGRLWGNGVDYLAWMFYMSKFYEIVDSLLILAKGRNTSTLQTYHHAGVMLCVWAGIRFMSPPSFIGYLLNSAIHAIMYGYYAAVTIRFPVPMIVKRGLTSMQIAQFIIGGLLAWSYVFVSYDIPFPLDPDLQEESNPGGNTMAARRVRCLDSSGQVFALLLTSIYLVPLTWLFVRFFIQRYLSGSKIKTQ